MWVYNKEQVLSAQHKICLTTASEFFSLKKVIEEWPEKEVPFYLQMTPCRSFTRVTILFNTVFRLGQSPESPTLFSTIVIDVVDDNVIVSDSGIYFIFSWQKKLKSLKFSDLASFVNFCTVIFYMCINTCFKTVFWNADKYVQTS